MLLIVGFCFVDEEWNADGKPGRSPSGNDSGKFQFENSIKEILTNFDLH